MKKSIVWLASYPKSGNTWTRIFIANYLANRQEPLPINQIHRFGIGDSIANMYHKAAGRQIDVGNIPLTIHLRERVLQGVVDNNVDINLMKTHNIRKTTHGVELIPAKFTRSAIYVMRNPLDMVLSYARHYSFTLERAVEVIGHSENANAPGPKNVAMFLGSWSEHVRSWTSLSPYPHLVLKYEDMLADPHTEFTKVLKHLGVPIDQERLDRAIEFSSFKELTRQEADSGFIEKPDNTEKFFSKGQSGQWKTDLSQDLVDQICSDHHHVMKRYGYLE